jgi:GH15 family glucan-1,4-alpha-glucosidase
MQHDIWGSILDSFYLHARSREQIPENLWPVLKKQVEEAIQHWRDPDRGIWEVRGEPQHFVSSKVMCWVALDRGAKLAERQGEKSYAQQWRKISEEIKEDILVHGVDSRGVFTQRYGDDALDASLLLVVLTRFLPPDDPRVRNTVLAIADELTEEGLVLRYRVEETDDGLSGEEGTFTICSFWLVSALVEIGEVARAKRLCERLLAYASPLHLYAEEIEPRTGRHLGNFPPSVHPPGTDQCGGARDPRRRGGRRFGDVPARQRARVSFAQLRALILSIIARAISTALVRGSPVPGSDALWTL